MTRHAKGTTRYHCHAGVLDQETGDVEVIRQHAAIGQGFPQCGLTIDEQITAPTGYAIRDAGGMAVALC